MFPTRCVLGRFDDVGNLARIVATLPRQNGPARNASETYCLTRRTTHVLFPAMPRPDSSAAPSPAPDRSGQGLVVARTSIAVAVSDVVELVGLISLGLISPGCGQPS